MLALREAGIGRTYPRIFLGRFDAAGLGFGSRGEA